MISTVLLLGTYLFTAFAAISFAGTGTDGLGLGNADNAADVLATLGPPVLGTALAKVVELAICVSAISALLTCVISSPRTTLSMGSHGALPKAFTRIHPKFQTPAFGTVFFGAAAAVLLAVLATVSDNFLGDAILSVGLLIAFYYGVTGLACVWYFRHRLTDFGARPVPQGHPARDRRADHARGVRPQRARHAGPDLRRHVLPRRRRGVPARRRRHRHRRRGDARSSAPAFPASSAAAADAVTHLTVTDRPIPT